MKQRRKRRVRLKWLPTLGAFSFVACAFALPWAVKNVGAKVPVKVKGLQIWGQTVLSENDLKSLSGIRKGDPLFAGSVESVVSRLTSHPRVAQAAVTRNATGEVQIQVVERKPAALVSLNDNALYFVDAKGNLFAKADLQHPRASELVVITGPWKIGGKNNARPDPSEFRQALELLSALTKEGISQEKISEIHQERPKGQTIRWSIYLVKSGLHVVMGNEHFVEKAKRLNRVLRDFERRETVVREIDLDFNDRAVVKLKRMT